MLKLLALFLLLIASPAFAQMPAVNSSPSSIPGPLAITGGATPAVSNTTSNSCGTSAATIVGKSGSFKVTVGATAGTSCTVTFDVAWAHAPSCVCTNETTANLCRATSTTTTTILAGTFVAADVVAGICQGWN